MANFKKSKFNGKKKGNTHEKLKDGSSEFKTSSVRYDSESNDWRWYVPNQQLLKDVGSLPFTNALGARNNRGHYGERYNDYGVPGVMRINYVPTIGGTTDTNSPMNICARNVYAFIKSFNSRAKTYDANDLMLYIGAMDSVLTYHAWLKRLYGLLNTVSYTNRYYPESAIRAAGGNYKDLLENITQLRGYINNFALRARALPLPRKFPVFARHQWLPSGVYLDSKDTLKPQSYVFTPACFHKFALDNDGAGMLDVVFPIGYSTPGRDKFELTFKQIVDLGEELLNAILIGAGEEDFNLIGADILASYGVNDVFRAEPIDDTYTVVPAYDEWVNDQINNIRCYGCPLDKSLRIIQSDNKSYLHQRPVVTVNKLTDVAVAQMDQMVNIFSTDNSPEHLIEATRFMSIPTVEENKTGQYLLYFDSNGTEIVTELVVYYYATETGEPGDWKLYRSPGYHTIITASVGSVTALDNTHTDETVVQVELQQIIDASLGLSEAIAEFTSFDRHPLVYVGFGAKVKWPDTDTPVDVVRGGHLELCDLNNYAIISASQLESMNDMALMGLYGLETYGR